MKDEFLTSMQVAKILGITSEATIRNWLHGGYFPGASQTENGEWTFKLSDVLAVKEDMDIVSIQPMTFPSRLAFKYIYEESEE